MVRDRGLGKVPFERIPVWCRFLLVQLQSARRRCNNGAFARVRPRVQAAGGNVPEATSGTGDGDPKRNWTFRGWPITSVYPNKLLKCLETYCDFLQFILHNIFKPYFFRHQHRKNIWNIPWLFITFFYCKPWSIIHKNKLLYQVKVNFEEARYAVILPSFAIQTCKEAISFSNVRRRRRFPRDMKVVHLFRKVTFSLESVITLRPRSQPLTPHNSETSVCRSLIACRALWAPVRPKKWLRKARTRMTICRASNLPDSWSYQRLCRPYGVKQYLNTSRAPREKEKNK